VLGPLLDALFPRRCAGCGSGPWPFCDRCHAALLPIEPPWCVRCGRPAERDVDGCAWCPPPPVSSARAPFVFRGPARSAVHRLKYAGWRAVAGALGAAMGLANECPRPDVVCWVPASPGRKARRGFDQAEALAAEVAQSLDAPAAALLRRCGEAVPQARRVGAERRAAMRGAFRLTADGGVPARVLLIDDVLTTGATVAACASALAAGGAAEIAVLTAARAIPARLPARYTRLGSRPGLWLPGEAFPGSRCQPRAKRPT
jgi:ComF family protein